MSQAMPTFFNFEKASPIECIHSILEDLLKSDHWQPGLRASNTSGISTYIHVGIFDMSLFATPLQTLNALPNTTPTMHHKSNGTWVPLAPNPIAASHLSPPCLSPLAPKHPFMPFSPLRTSPTYTVCLTCSPSRTVLFIILHCGMAMHWARPFLPGYDATPLDDSILYIPSDE